MSKQPQESWEIEVMRKYNQGNGGDVAIVNSVSELIGYIRSEKEKSYREGWDARYKQMCEDDFRRDE